MHNSAVHACCRPDVVTFNIVVYRVCKDGLLEEAFELFLIMKSSKVMPDVFT